MKKVLGYGLVFLLLPLVLSNPLAAQEDQKEDPFTPVPDDPVLAAMDSMMAVLYGDAYAPATVNDSFVLKDWDSSLIATQLAELDNQTPFHLVYNDAVNKYIQVYALKKQKVTARLLGLASYYFPLFEEYLDRYDLPLELKYLAMVESALNPRARSRSGALGLWQFMYRTGKIYGLKSTSYYDERMDIFKSTDAACRYFVFLHKMLGDWELVLAAYNAGPGTVSRAIRRSGGKSDYWALWPYLPRETRGYVPAFIAVNYVMNYAGQFGIKAVQPPSGFFEYDTVCVSRQVSFEQISQVIKIPVKDLAKLNPVYKRSFIPARKEGYSNLVLPNKMCALFIQNEDSIYTWKVRKPEIDSSAVPFFVEEKRRTHVVRRGEYLGYIARKYGCSVNDIKDWNGMRSTRIKPGQRLRIYVTVKKNNPKYAAKDNKSVDEPSTPEKPSFQGRYYTIQRGDTLWDIARANGVSVDQIRLVNKGISAHGLKPGMKIKIPGS